MGWELASAFWNSFICSSLPKSDRFFSQVADHVSNLKNSKLLSCLLILRNGNGCPNTAMLMTAAGGAGFLDYEALTSRCLGFELHSIWGFLFGLVSLLNMKLLFNVRKTKASILPTVALSWPRERESWDRKFLTENLYPYPTLGHKKSGSQPFVNNKPNNFLGKKKK